MKLLYHPASLCTQLHMTHTHTHPHTHPHTHTHAHTPTHTKSTKGGKRKNKKEKNKRKLKALYVVWEVQVNPLRICTLASSGATIV